MQAPAATLAQRHRGKVRQPRQCPDHGWVSKRRTRPRGGDFHVTLHSTDNGGQLQAPVESSCNLGTAAPDHRAGRQDTAPCRRIWSPPQGRRLPRLVVGSIPSPLAQSTVQGTKPRNEGAVRGLTAPKARKRRLVERHSCGLTSTALCGDVSRQHDQVTALVFYLRQGATALRCGTAGWSPEGVHRAATLYAIVPHKRRC